MSTRSVQNTAQIIRFPTGGRKAMAESTRQTQAVTDLETQAAAVAAGEAWYHDAAIEDSRRTGER